MTSTTPTLTEMWSDAYKAFKGAFDTPQMRRTSPDEYSTDARKRLREFDEAFRVAANEAAPAAAAMAWHLDGSMSALLHTMTGSEDSEEATPVTLFVGKSRDDDGKTVYGLHAYESEYPEEGVTPLVEFDPPVAPAGPSVDAIREKLTRIMVGGCTCLTKAPGVQYHSERCHYRLASEATDLLAAPASPSVEGVGRKALAAAIHYPDCWDQAAYPTLASALNEMAAAFICTNDDCASPSPAADAEKTMFQSCAVPIADSGYPFLRCGCGATWPCAKHPEKGSAASPSPAADAVPTASELVLRDALDWARPYVERASTQWYDGTNGQGIREEAARRLAIIDAALAATTDGSESAAPASLPPAGRGEPEPYAYEFGRSNGDDTYSIVIERGDMVQIAPGKWRYGPPRSPHPDHPVKPLYAAEDQPK